MRSVASRFGAKPLTVTWSSSNCFRKSQGKTAEAAEKCPTLIVTDGKKDSDIVSWCWDSSSSMFAASVSFITWFPFLQKVSWNLETQELSSVMSRS